VADWRWPASVSRAVRRMGGASAGCGACRIAMPLVYFVSYHPSPVPSTAPPARFVCVIFFVKGAGVSAGSIQTCCSVAHFVPISQERNVRAQWHDCQKSATRRAASATPPRPIQRSRTAGALHAGGKTSILSHSCGAVHNIFGGQSATSVPCSSGPGGPARTRCPRCGGCAAAP
jgi:hypothetical protein